MKALVTGSKGFIGRNLVSWLKHQEDIRTLEFGRENTGEELHAQLGEADIVYHLAGVNRPQSVEAFETGNVDLTVQVCRYLLQLGRRVPLILSSSVQAELGNPYGASKRRAEEAVADYAERSGAPGIIYRLTNVFGKWCRPNYNSVVATFCHNVARDLPIQVSDPDRELELIHVDDVVQHFWQEARREVPGGVHYRTVNPTYPATLGGLAALIQSFRQMRKTLQVPDLSDAFTRKLYGTYLSYLEESDFGYALQQRCDPRGCLAEFLKSAHAGQIFVSTTVPGVTRGNHYHDTKTEKFLVLHGEAAIRFRQIEGDDILEYQVSGNQFQVVDIPPGYTHSIENVGRGELVTLFWASEVYDPNRPDTYYLPVLPTGT